MNIRPKYSRGISLSPGSYHIRVSAPGFLKRDQWIKLSKAEEKYVSIQLPPLQKTVETPPSITKPQNEIAKPAPAAPKPETAAPPETQAAAPVRFFNNIKRAFDSWKEETFTDSPAPRKSTRGDLITNEPTFVKPSSDAGP
jgi:hypothetical protein